MTPDDRKRLRELAESVTNKSLELIEDPQIIDALLTAWDNCEPPEQMLKLLELMEEAEQVTRMINDASCCKCNDLCDCDADARQEAIAFYKKLRGEGK